MVREIAAELAGRAAVVQVNTQQNSRVAARLGVRGIPALFLLEQGKVLERLDGAQPKSVVLSVVSRHLRQA